MTDTTQRDKLTERLDIAIHYATGGDQGPGAPRHTDSTDITNAVMEVVGPELDRVRADERKRIVAMLKERVLWEYNDSPKVADALKYAADLIESETSHG